MKLSDLIEKFKKDFAFRFEPDLSRLELSINSNGILTPIIVEEDYILTGYSRIKIAEKLGIEEIPIVRQNFRSDYERLRLIYFDNLQSNLDLIDLSRLLSLFKKRGMSKESLREFSGSFDINSLLRISQFPKKILRILRSKKYSDERIIFIGSVEEVVRKVFFYLIEKNIKLTVPDMKEVMYLLKIGKWKYDNGFIKNFLIELNRIPDKISILKIKNILFKKVYPEEYDKIEKLMRKINEFNNRIDGIQIEGFNDITGELNLRIEAGSIKDVLILHKKDKVILEKLFRFIEDLGKI
ncbi:MAG: hypothetical protein ACTSVV_10630 [Promethearchaeota archaeon]